MYGYRQLGAGAAAEFTRAGTILDVPAKKEEQREVALGPFHVRAAHVAATASIVAVTRCTGTIPADGPLGQAGDLVNAPLVESRRPYETGA